MAAGSTDVSLGINAFGKLLSHCFKYPHQAVNGVLLAKERQKQATSDPSQQQEPLHIVDCMPLFHQCLGLTPMLEVALAQIDQFCKGKGLAIAGYYQANEHLRDAAPDAVAHRIADKIAEHFPGACLVMVDNDSLAVYLATVPLVVYGLQDGRWKERGCIVKDLVLEAASAMLKEKTYRVLVDFDNHLDDVRRDWSNREISVKIVDEFCRLLADAKWNSHSGGSLSAGSLGDGKDVDHGCP